MENDISRRPDILTFRYGQFSPQKIIIVILSICIPLLICCLSILIWSIVSGAGTDSRGLQIGMVFCCGFYLVGIVVAILLICRNHVIKNNIRLWLSDKNIVEREVVPFRYSQGGGVVAGPIKVGVRFRYNGHRILMFSKKYSVAFYKIIDKRIKILYSPKYHEIIILSQ